MNIASAILAVGMSGIMAATPIEHARAQSAKYLVLLGGFVAGLVVGSNDASAAEKEAETAKEKAERQKEIDDAVKHSLNTERSEHSDTSGDVPRFDGFHFVTHQGRNMAAFDPNLLDNLSPSLTARLLAPTRSTNEGSVTGASLDHPAVARPATGDTGVLGKFPALDHTGLDPDWLEKFLAKNHAAAHSNAADSNTGSQKLPFDRDWMEKFSLSASAAAPPASGAAGATTESKPSAVDDWIRNTLAHPAVAQPLTAKTAALDSDWFKTFAVPSGAAASSPAGSTGFGSRPAASAPSTRLHLVTEGKLYKVDGKLSAPTTAQYCVSYVAGVCTPCDWNGSACVARHEKLIDVNTGNQLQ